MAHLTISTTLNTGITLSATAAYGSPLTITATGVVNGGDATAIYSRTAAKITNFGTIDSSGAAGIVFHANGIVNNFGTITAGSGDAAIYFEAGGMLINNGVINSGYGVEAAAADTSAITVHNYGTITATQIYAGAVYASAGGTVTNSAGAELKGNETGIFIEGSSGASVTNSGSIDGFGTGGGDGIGVILLSSISNVLTNASSGTITGRNAGIIIGNAPATVINAGDISGQNGIFLASATLSNVGYVENSGTVSAYSSAYLNGGVGSYSGRIGIGVYFANSGTVVNKGLLSGNDGGIKIERDAGVVGNSGTIRAANGTGVDLQDGGSVSNSGTISSLDSGVTIEASGRVINSGYISGYNGVDLGTANLSNTGYVYNAGTINAYNSANLSGSFGNGFDTTGIGVYLANSGTVVNKGSISGNHVGVVIERAAGVVQNTGTITSTQGVGVYLYLGSSVNNSGVIRGSSQGLIVGIQAFTDSQETRASTLINSGYVSASGQSGEAVLMESKGTIDNAVGGTIEAPHGGGIVLTAVNDLSTADADISNEGLVKAAYGIFFSYGLGGVQNTGTVIGSDLGIELGSNATVVNAGLVESQALTSPIYGTGGGVLFTDGGVLTNTSSGVITSRQDAVLVQTAAGTISNAGDISGKYGIVLNASGVVTNLADGTISANIGIIADGYLSVANAGLIEATGVGITLSAGGSITNSATGTIAGSSYGIKGGYLGQPPDANFATSIVNSGVIYGVNSVALLEGGALTNEASGLISSSLTVVYLYSVLSSIVNSVTNFGTIEGSGGTGVFVVGAIANLTNIGLITDASGVRLIGNNGTLTNAGTITGTLGAVLLFGTSDELIVDPGAVFNGQVGDAGAAGILALAGGTTGTISGIGSEFYGFSTLSVNTGAIWDIAGATTIANVRNNGTIIGSNLGLALGSNAAVINAGLIEGIGIGQPSVGITLSAGGSITNSATGTIASTSYGIEGSYKLSNFTSIVNSGVIEGGVALHEGGVLTNEASGVINGPISGIYLGGGSSSVVNSITNFGTIEGGVAMREGGVFTNAVSGIISSSFDYGFVLSADNATLTNAGTITGQLGAVSFFGTGDELIVDPGAIFNGQVYDGGATGTLALAGSTTGTISGIGSEFAGFSTLDVDTGAIWDITGANTIANVVDNGTILNNGTIIGPHSGIVLGSNAAVINAGLLEGGTGISGVGITLSAGGSVTNSATGTIAGYRYGIEGGYLGQQLHGANFAASIVNSGVIDGNVALHEGGALTNAASGVISAEFAGVYLGGSSSSIVNNITNSGTIEADVDLSGAGASLNNSGLITGQVGVLLFGDNATLTNAGIISGLLGYSVTLDGNHDELIIDPGAVFNGLVYDDFGNGTLALAGSTTGTISGIGSEFHAFSTLDVNTGAVWDIAPGADTIANVLDNGTLMIGSGGSLDISSTLNAASSGVFMLTGGTLEIGAVLGSTAKMQFLGTSSNQLIIDSASSFGTGVGTASYAGPLLQDFGAGDSIDIKGLNDTNSATYFAVSGDLQIGKNGIAVATLQFQNASLGAGDFHFASDNAGGLLITHS